MSPDEPQALLLHSVTDDNGGIIITISMVKHDRQTDMESALLRSITIFTPGIVGIIITSPLVDVADEVCIVIASTSRNGKIQHTNSTQGEGLGAEIVITVEASEGANNKIHCAIGIAIVTVNIEHGNPHTNDGMLDIDSHTHGMADVMGLHNRSLPGTEAGDEAIAEGLRLAHVGAAESADVMRTLAIKSSTLANVTDFEDGTTVKEGGITIAVSVRVGNGAIAVTFDEVVVRPVTSGTALVSGSVIAIPTVVENIGGDRNIITIPHIIVNGIDHMRQVITHQEGSTTFVSTVEPNVVVADDMKHCSVGHALVTDNVIHGIPHSIDHLVMMHAHGSDNPQLTGTKEGDTAITAGK